MKKNSFAECLIKNTWQRAVCRQIQGRVTYAEGGTRQNFCLLIFFFIECQPAVSRSVCPQQQQTCIRRESINS